MRVIFAGTPAFAVPTLSSLIQSQHDVVAVYTQPDKPAGRGRHLQASPIKRLANENSIPVEQPERLSSSEVQARLAAYDADIMVVIAYGLLLPKDILIMPKYGCINVHASLLPRWRGAAPIQHAILAGDKQTGVTIMQMTPGLDEGDSLLQSVLPLSDKETSASVHAKLGDIGASSLLEALDAIEQQTITPVKQDSTQVTYASKIKKQDAKVDWEKSAQAIHRMIRAYNPWPVAYCEYQGVSVRLWHAEVIAESSIEKPGTVVRMNKEGIDVATGDGILRLLSLQLPGGKKITGADFANSQKTCQGFE